MDFKLLAETAAMLQEMEVGTMSHESVRAMIALIALGSKEYGIVEFAILMEDAKKMRADK